MTIVYIKIPFGDPMDLQVSQCSNMFNIWIKQILIKWADYIPAFFLTSVLIEKLRFNIQS